jgi:hypothetical protein
MVETPRKYFNVKALKNGNNVKMAIMEHTSSKNIKETYNSSMVRK